MLNPLILNDKSFVSFNGDSEYHDNNDNHVMGYWHYVDVIKNDDGNDSNLTLDSMINETELYKPNPLFKVKNDKSELCLLL